MKDKMSRHDFKEVTGGRYSAFKREFEQMSECDLQKNIIVLTQDKQNAQKKLHDIQSSLKMDIPINPLEIEDNKKRLDNLDLKLSAAKAAYNSRLR